jgi:glutathione S-transferase
MAALANIELISAVGCPYVQRSVALLVHHKIPFTIKSVDLQNKPQWLFEKSPLGKVPSLVRGNDYIFESQVINEFIEDSLPLEQRVQPADPFIRGQNKAWIEFGSSFWETFMAL